MFWDTFYFFKYSKFLPNIVLPLVPCDSGDMCELALTWGNLHCLFVHSILIMLQLGFLLVAPPMALLFPLWMTVLFVASFFVVNQALCQILNGSHGLVFESDPRFAKADQSKFAHEKWFFLNGVAAGEHWMQNTLNRLALTFGRQVTGIHNRTSGIVFDVIECLVQRNFTFATSDIRQAHQEVKRALLGAQYSRVVFVLHSQGAIEGGMVLDWLLQELPQDLMGKLEVYTFGNAANHFNNPYTSAQALATVEHRELLESTQEKGAFGFTSIEQNTHHFESEKGEASLLSSFLQPQQPPSPPHSPLFNIKPRRQQQQQRDHNDRSERNRSATTPSSSDLQAVSRPGPSSSPTSVGGARVVHHIEHYAFSTDVVAMWGVLHFATSKLANNSIPKFVGRLFARTDPQHRGGHQLVQHYLDRMFPLQTDSSGKFVGCRETNDFMDSEVILEEPDSGSREGLARSLHGCFEDDDAVDDMEREVQLRSGEGTTEVWSKHKMSGGKVKVKELSRLWQYRNGRSPPSKSPVLAAGSDGRINALMV